MKQFFLAALRYAVILLLIQIIFDFSILHIDDMRLVRRIAEGHDGRNLLRCRNPRGPRPGQDGHSPVVTASKSGSTTTIYVDGTSIATIEDG